jgi:hypothetical protein
MAGHVEDRGAELAGLQRLDEGFLVDERTAADVAEDGPGLHGRERGRVEEVLGVGGGRNTRHHRVAPPEHRVEVGGAGQLVDCFVLLSRRVAPPGGEHGHAERPSPHGDGGADGAQSDDAQDCALGGAADFRRPAPFALELLDLGKPLPHGEDPRQRELGDGNRCDARSIRDHAVKREAGIVEVIDAGADRLDPAEVRSEARGVGGNIERERDIGARPDRAPIVGELVALVLGEVAEAAQVGHDDELGVGEAFAKLYEQRVVGDHRVGDDDRGHDATASRARRARASAGPSPGTAARIASHRVRSSMVKHHTAARSATAGCDESGATPVAANTRQS